MAKYFLMRLSSHSLSNQIYVSPGQKKVRADAAGDGFLEASFFDFTNTTSNGTLVANAIVSFEGGVTTPTCSSFLCVYCGHTGLSIVVEVVYSVPPFVEVFPSDFLFLSNAVFAGIQFDELYGAVDAWTFSVGGFLTALCKFFESTSSETIPYRKGRTYRLRSSWIQTTPLLDLTLPLRTPCVLSPQRGSLTLYRVP